MSRIKSLLTYKNGLFGYIVLCLFSILFNYLLYTNIDLLLDSDMSSELVLAELMAKEKTFLPTSWYYSTELRLINTQLVFAPLFLITNNYHLVRIVGCFIIQVILVLVFYKLTKVLNIKNYIYYVIFFVSANSLVYFDYFIKAPHYFPYLIISFIVFYLLVTIFKKTNNREKYTIEFISSCIIALLSCFNSTRQMLTTYIPIFASGFVVVMFKLLTRKTINKKYLLVVSTIFVFAAIGLLIGSSDFIKQVYEFSTYGLSVLKIELADFSRLLDIVYCWLNSFGYVNSCGNVYKYISLLIALLLITYSIYVSVKMILNNNDEISKYLSIFYLSSFPILSSVFVLTSMYIEPRYFALNTILAYIVIGLYISKYGTLRIANYLLLLFYFFSIINSFVVLSYEVSLRKNDEIISIKNVLEDNNVCNGYATFWNGNILTELSDGKIEVWQYYSGIDALDITKEDILDLSKSSYWLQKKSHYYNAPCGKVFLLLNDETNSIDRELLEDYKYYDSKKFNLYIFDDYNQLKMKLK